MAWAPKWRIAACEGGRSLKGGTRTSDVRHTGREGLAVKGLRVFVAPRGSPQGGFPFRIGHVGEDAVS